jgi:hypothetical protein
VEGNVFSAVIVRPSVSNSKCKNSVLSPCKENENLVVNINKENENIVFNGNNENENKENGCSLTKIHIPPDLALQKHIPPDLALQNS